MVKIDSWTLLHVDDVSTVGDADVGLMWLYDPQVTIVVLGNKLDKQDERRVDSNMAQNWAKTEKVRLWEVSVVDRRTLIEPFVYLASKMTQPQSKSTFPLSRNKNKGSGSGDSWVTIDACRVEKEKGERRCWREAGFSGILDILFG